MSSHISAHALKFAIDVGRLVIWLVLLVALFVPIERLFELRPVKIWRKQVGVDLAWYFINSFIPAAIIAIPLSFLARSLDGLDPFGFYSTVASWPFWVKLPLAFLISDFGAYWAHRALHANLFLWRFHAIHHSAEDIDWLVTSRAHPFDIVFTRLCGLSLVYLCGFAQALKTGLDPAAAFVTIFDTVWAYFIHANVRLRLGPLEWLISSPAFHHWHHTNDEHRDKNFAAIFPVYDKIFGTAWLPKYWPPVYGIDAKVSPSFMGQLLDPISAPADAFNSPPAPMSKPAPAQELKPVQ